MEINVTVHLMPLAVSTCTFSQRYHGCYAIQSHIIIFDPPFFDYTITTAVLFCAISIWLRIDIIFSHGLKQQLPLMDEMQTESCESSKAGLPGQ